MRAIRRPAACVPAVFAAMGVMHAAAAEEIEDWPCEVPMVEALTLQDLDGSVAVAAPTGDWQADAEVKTVVLTASDPENPPEKGEAVIAALARDAAADGPRRMALVLAGLLDESNDLRRILIEGIKDNVLRAKVVGNVIAENDAALAALPDPAAVRPVEPAGSCPVCGTQAIANVVYSEGALQGVRFLFCPLCAGEWHVVRIKCVNGQSTKGIAYHHVPEQPAVKAETCNECRTYTKII